MLDSGSWNHFDRLFVVTGSIRGETPMFKTMFSWMGRLFAPRGDNFKALLMADLGLKR